MSVRRDGDVDEKSSNEGPDRYGQGMMAIVTVRQSRNEREKERCGLL